MSEVNADGVLLNPQEHLLQEVQNLTNSLMAEPPAGAGRARPGPRRGRIPYPSRERPTSPPPSQRRAKTAPAARRKKLKKVKEQ